MKANKKGVLTNYRKSQNLIAKIIEMTQGDESSIEILKQNILATRFLKLIHKNLMEDYFESCFNKGVRVRNIKKKEEMAKEILTAVRLYNK